jgi:hypothetical protein
MLVRWLDGDGKSNIDPEPEKLIAAVREILSI